MKKLPVFLMIMFLCAAFASTSVKASANIAKSTLTVVVPADSIQARALLSKLEALKTIDKSTLSASEKKQLRKEVRATKSEYRKLNGGVYLSAGAVILIVVLLVLLL